MEQLGSQWTDFNDTWYMMVSRKFGEKIRVLIENTWKIEKNKRYLKWIAEYT